MEGDTRVGLRGDSCAISAHEHAKFRSRWHRWLGQKCRVDKPYWVTLLNTNWMSWANGVIGKNGLNRRMRDNTRDDVKEWFTLAITFADDRDLCRLDNLYASEKIE